MFYTITFNNEPRKSNGKRIVYQSVDEVQLGLQQLNNDFPNKKFSFIPVRKNKKDIIAPQTALYSGREVWA